MESLETQLALIASEVKALRERGDDRHRDNVYRMDEIRDDVKEMKGDVKVTNGGIAKAQMDIAEHRQRLSDAEGKISKLQSSSTGVVKEADLKFWGGVIFLACSSTAAVVLWVVHLVQAGKL